MIHLIIAVLGFLIVFRVSALHIPPKQTKVPDIHPEDLDWFLEQYLNDTNDDYVWDSGDYALMEKA